MKLFLKVFLFLFFISIGNLFSQSISNVNPASANLGQTLTVTISGQSTSFGQGTSTTNVWFSQGSSTLIYSSNITINNSGSLDAGFVFPNNLPTGNYTVNVLNSLDGQMTLPNGFLLNPNPNPPVLLSATPDSSALGQTLTVTISGQHTNFSQGTTTANVWFSQGTSTLIYPTNAAVINDSTISASFTIPSNAVAGYYAVNSSDPLDGQLTLSNGFLINGCGTPIVAVINNPYPTICAGASVTLTASGGTTYSWFNGMTGPTIVVSPTSTTTYSVIASGGGCPADTTSATVAMNPKPVADFSSNNVCFNNPTVFTDLSTSQSGAITAWNWDFGDGNTSPIQNSTHNYLAAGSYTVTLIVASSFGCEDTIQKAVVVNPLPTANFTSAPVCNSNPMCFTDKSTIATGLITSWSWNFGDTSSISNSQNPCHTYSRAGSFSVTLTVSSDSGCQSTTILPVTVNKSSSASLTMTKDTTNPLLWYIQPTITGTAPFTYLWSFGDGDTSTLPNPTHTYTVAGHYAICLTVTDANGCSSSTCDSTYRITASGLIQSLIVLNPLTGIEENLVSVNAVFPNPSNKSITVLLSQLVKGELMITDITGREVYKENVNADNIQVNVSNLPAGYYTLSIFSGTKIMHEKIMIAR